MARARIIRTAGLVGAAALVAAGCGGGEPVPPAGGTPAPSPTPGATTPGAETGGTDGAGAVDPATGLPLDPAATDAGMSATVPSLEGDDIGGGLSPINGSPIFEAGAITVADADEQAKAREAAAAEAASEATNPTTSQPAKEAVSYSGAKIYVDGVVHDVAKQGTFPKGNPVFRLLAVSGSSIEIELVAGEFTTNGGTGTILDKGELVSLLNTSEELTYRVKYLRPVTESSSIDF